MDVGGLTVSTTVSLEEKETKRKYTSQKYKQLIGIRAVLVRFSCPKLST